MPDAPSDPIAERRDEVLKRMLNTPPKPHKPKEKSAEGRKAAEPPKAERKTKAR